MGMFADDNGNGNGSTRDDSWKSDAFINCLLPRSGTEKNGKLGKLGLKLRYKDQKKLIQWLHADGDEKLAAKRLEKLKQSLILTFEMVDNEKADFDLFDDE